MSRTTLWLRLILLLLPADFRQRHAREIELTLESCLEERGPVGRMLARMRTVLDVLMVAIPLRMKRFGDMTKKGMTMGELTGDLRFALRALARRPGFSLTAVLTLGIGIGANTAIFSVVDGVLLRPLNYEAGDRIGILWHRFGDGAQDLPAIHALDARDYRDRASTFEDLTMAIGREWILGGPDDPEVVDVGVVEAGFFDFFGVEPEFGRTILPEEDVPGRPPVLMLSHRIWERRYGADPGIVGRSVPVAGTQMEVVGVLPEDFRLELPSEAFLLRDAEVWTSLRLDPARTPPRNYTGFTAFARLTPGTSFESAQAEVETMAARLREEHPEHAASRLEARIVPLLADVVKDAKQTLYLLLGSVGFVLLIACANVANLVISRSQTRRTELALRSALGAGRSGLVRLVLAESAVLAAGGLAVGLTVALGGLEALERLGPGSVPRLSGVEMDGRVLVFAAGITVLATALFGLLPALRASRRAPADALRGASGATESRGSRRLRDLLIVGEVAASVVLLVGTGLLVRSFVEMGRIDPGYALNDVLTFRTNLPAGLAGSREEALTLRTRILDELEALPGVESAATVNQLPLTGSGALQPYAYDEETASNWESVTADQRFVSPGFFEAIGAVMIGGRSFAGDPAVDEGTIVVDDRLAERAFPGEDAVGQRLQVNPNDAPEEIRYATVIGVVRHLNLHDLAAPYLTQIWYPESGGPRFSVVVRTEDDATAVAASAREIVGRLAPGAPVEDVRTMAELASGSLAALRLTLSLMTAFGLVALLLASVGIYGVISQSVSRRTREIGVRMALGQRPGAVVGSLLAQGGQLVGIALLVGLPIAAALGRSASGLLFGIEAFDAPTYLTVVVTLTAVAFLACWIPARRATRVDPVEALRE